MCTRGKESTRGFLWAWLFYYIRINFQMPQFIKVEKRDRVKERKRRQKRRGGMAYISHQSSDGKEPNLSLLQHLRLFIISQSISTLQTFSQLLSFDSHIHSFPPSSLHLLMVRRNVLPSGPGTCRISCFAREQGGERLKRRRRRKGEQRGTEPEEETHTEKEKQRDGGRGREGGKRRRMEASCAYIWL